MKRRRTVPYPHSVVEITDKIVHFFRAKSLCKKEAMTRTLSRETVFPCPLRRSDSAPNPWPQAFRPFDVRNGERRVFPFLKKRLVVHLRVEKPVPDVLFLHFHCEVSRDRCNASAWNPGSATMTIDEESAEDSEISFMHCAIAYFHAEILPAANAVIRQ